MITRRWAIVVMTSAYTAPATYKHGLGSWLRRSSLGSTDIGRWSSGERKVARILIEAAELDAYAPLVTRGCYLIVEDTRRAQVTARSQASGGRRYLSASR